ncbi:hypothetical protein GCM10022200_23990 [Microbacterium awajiense]|uniref:DUF2345 domain-containing protein n=1 Tax=Microbacterium awajiense TaxID=415214 RepID=A0ABP7ASK1_9MICO
MASDIVLDDTSITLQDADTVTISQGDRRVEINLRSNRSRMVVGSDEAPGFLTLDGTNARISIMQGGVIAQSASVREELSVGSGGGEGGTHPGSIRVTGRTGVLLTVDGAAGQIEIAGHGNLLDRLAELAALRATVSRLESRVRALES